MIPDERTCQYFMTIAREKNISRAARCLYISQPSLSRFLTGLEKELGTPLFIRNNGILSLTPAGQLFFQYIAGLKETESRFSKDLSSLLLPQKRTLKIGAGSITSPFLAEKVFPILHREYPDVELSLTEDLHVHLLSRLNNGELDLSVLVASGADALSSRFVKILAQAPRLFMISRSHPLASLVTCPEENSIENPQMFSLHHLENKTLVSGVPGQKICEDISQIVTKYGLRNLSLIPVQNRKTNIAMAECGLAIAFLPAIYVTAPEEHRNLLYLYSDDPLAQWRMTVRHKNSCLTPIKRRFIDLASAVFSGKEPV